MSDRQGDVAEHRGHKRPGGFRRTNVLASIAGHEKAGDGVLSVDERRIDGDEPAAVDEALPGERECLNSGIVVEMMEHADSEGHRTLTDKAGVEILHRTGHELPSVAESFLSVGGVVAARIEAQILTRWKMIEYVSGAATDIQDSIVLFDSEQFPGDHVTEPIGTDRRLGQTVDRGGGEDGSPPGRSLGCRHRPESTELQR